MLVFSLLLGLIEGFITAFWSALLAGYLWYTAYNGRDELIYKPDFQDLIFYINDDRHPSAIIRQIHLMDSRYLPNAIFPVIREGRLDQVIIGNELEKLPESGESLHHLYRPANIGYYVDIENTATYKSGVKLQADFIPVLQNGAILGMSDAHEIRFWLMQQKQQNEDGHKEIPAT